MLAHQPFAAQYPDDADGSVGMEGDMQEGGLTIVAVPANVHETKTGVTVKRGRRYLLTVPAMPDGAPQEWQDAKLRPCTGDGFIPPPHLWVAYPFLRQPFAPWFCLLGSVGGGRPFRVGVGREITGARDGELSLFANDVRWGRRFYENNRGALTVEIALVE